MSKLSKILLISMLLYTGSIQLYVLNKISQLTRSIPQISDQLADFSSSETAKDNLQHALVFRLSEIDREFITETIKTVVKTEIENMPQKSIAVAGSCAEEKIQVSSSRQSSESFEKSRTILDQAITRGGWTQEDFAEILPYVNDLTPEQRDQLSLRFVESINSGQIDVKNINKGIIPF